MTGPQGRPRQPWSWPLEQEALLLQRDRATLSNYKTSHLKTRVPDLSYGIICVILGLAVLIQYRSVTDTHTDTRRQHIPRLARRRTVKTHTTGRGTACEFFPSVWLDQSFAQLAVFMLMHQWAKQIDHYNYASSQFLTDDNTEKIVHKNIVLLKLLTNKSL